MKKNMIYLLKILVQQNRLKITRHKVFWDSNLAVLTIISFFQTEMSILSKKKTRKAVEQTFLNSE